MKKLNEVEKHKRHVKIATISGCAVVALLAAGTIWQFGNLNKKESPHPFH